MIRTQHHVFSLASLFVTVFVASHASAATVTQVDRGTWGASGVPSYVSMYIQVPDTPAERPPVLVACHSCGTPVSGYTNSIQTILSAANQNGFIVILPEATGRNCWDVGTSQALTHDGGGDTQAIVQMVQYVLGEYNGDAERVYVLGGSSGAMMAQALLAVYPDVFKAGSARAGVPAGCWADGFDPGQQWSGNCAGGRTSKSAEQWGEQARGMFASFDGPRPRVQLFHGTSDTTISYNNMGEAIKQWTNVLGLSTEPSSTDTLATANSNYDREFWTDECGYTVLEAWSGQGGSHSMPYEQEAILEFFGLDQAGGEDPQVAACAQQGGADDETQGAGGAGEQGAGGSAASEPGAGGAQGSEGSGGAPAGDGSGGGPQGNGGALGAGGSQDNGGAPGAGGSQGNGGTASDPAGSTGGAAAGGTPPLGAGGHPGDSTTETSGTMMTTTASDVPAGAPNAGTGTAAPAGAAPSTSASGAGSAPGNGVVAAGTDATPPVGEAEDGGCALHAHASSAARASSMVNPAMALGLLGLLAFARRRRASSR